MTGVVLLLTVTAWAQLPGRCEAPISERTGAIGCYILENQPLGPLPDIPLFWHLYVFPTRVAADAAKAPRASIVEAFGRIWRFSIAPPDWRAPIHTHAGPEAWYLVEGAECLETPEGTTVAHAGDSVVVREGLPMILSSVGTEMRKTFALVLHDSAKPWTMVMQSGEWKPAGRCPK